MSVTLPFVSHAVHRYLQRTWCLYELWTAMQNAKCNVEILHTDGFLPLPAECTKIIVQLENSSTTLPQDKAYISGMVESSIGLETFNQSVKSRLVSLVSQAHHAADVAPIAFTLSKDAGVHSTSTEESSTDPDEFEHRPFVALTTGNAYGAHPVVDFTFCDSSTDPDVVDCSVRYHGQASQDEKRDTIEDVYTSVTKRSVTLFCDTIEDTPIDHENTFGSIPATDDATENADGNSSAEALLAHSYVRRAEQKECIDDDDKTNGSDVEAIRSTIDDHKYMAFAGTGDSSCQLYVVADLYNHSVAAALDTARCAIQNAFDGGNVNDSTNIRCHIGMANPFRVSATCENRVLPCLMWIATGPNVYDEDELTEDAEVDERSITCPFLEVLAENQVSVNTVVICMAVGSDWVTQQLLKKGIAKRVVSIRINTFNSDFTIVYNACAKMAHLLFRSASFQNTRSCASHPSQVSSETGVNLLSDVVDHIAVFESQLREIWIESFRLLQHCCQYSVFCETHVPEVTSDGADSTPSNVGDSGTSLSATLRGVCDQECTPPDASSGAAHGDVLRYSPLRLVLDIPYGHFYGDSLQRSTHDSYLDGFDPTHIADAQALADCMTEGLTMRSGLCQYICVVPTDESTSSAAAVAATIRHACHRVGTQTNVDFIECVPNSKDGNVAAHLESLQHSKSGIIWLHSNEATVDEQAVVRMSQQLYHMHNQDCNEHHHGKGAWIVVLEMTPIAWARWADGSPLGGKSESFFITPMHTRGCERRMRHSQPLLRLRNAYGVDVQSLKEELEQLFTDGGGITAMYPDVTDVVVSMVVHSFRGLQRVRQDVFLGTLTAQLQHRLHSPTISVDATFFAEQCAAIPCIYLTAHQFQAVQSGIAVMDTYGSATASACEARPVSGARVAITGPSGSGKSFVAQYLLARLLLTWHSARTDAVRTSNATSDGGSSGSVHEGAVLSSADTADVCGKSPEGDIVLVASSVTAAVLLSHGLFSRLHSTVGRTVACEILGDMYGIWVLVPPEASAASPPDVSIPGPTTDVSATGVHSTIHTTTAAMFYKRVHASVANVTAGPATGPLAGPPSNIRALLVDDAQALERGGMDFRRHVRQLVKDCECVLLCMEEDNVVTAAADTANTESNPPIDTITDRENNPPTDTITDTEIKSPSDTITDTESNADIDITTDTARQPQTDSNADTESNPPTESSADTESKPQTDSVTDPATNSNANGVFDNNVHLDSPANKECNAQAESIPITDSDVDTENKPHTDNIADTAINTHNSSIADIESNPPTDGNIGTASDTHSDSKVASTTNPPIDSNADTDNVTHRVTSAFAESEGDSCPRTAIEFRHTEQAVVRLTENVRAPKRILYSLIPFYPATAPIQGYSDVEGPKLTPYVFPACKNPELLRQTYAATVWLALSNLHREYPEVLRVGNCVVVTPDHTWATWLRRALTIFQKVAPASGDYPVPLGGNVPMPVLDFADTATYDERYAVRWDQQSTGHVHSPYGGKPDEKQAVGVAVDAVDAMRGRESTAVIAVHLDAAHATPTQAGTCAPLCRSLALALLHVVVVQERVEEVPGAPDTMRSLCLACHISYGVVHVG